MKVLFIGKFGAVNSAMCEMMTKQGQINLNHVDADLFIKGEDLSHDDPPGVIVIDVSSLPANPMDSLKKIQRLYPGIPVLVMHYYTDPILIQEFIQAGASKYLPLNTSASELLKTLYQLLEEN